MKKIQLQSDLLLLQRLNLISFVYFYFTKGESIRSNNDISTAFQNQVLNQLVIHKVPPRCNLHLVIKSSQANDTDLVDRLFGQFRAISIVDVEQLNEGLPTVFWSECNTFVFMVSGYFPLMREAFDRRETGQLNIIAAKSMKFEIGINDLMQQLLVNCPPKSEILIISTFISDRMAHSYSYIKCLHCIDGKPGFQRVFKVALPKHKTENHQLETIIKGWKNPFQYFNRHHYEGRKFVVSSLIMAPYFDGTRLPINQNGQVYFDPKDSFDLRIIRTASQVMNFTFAFKRPDDGQWGYTFPNKSWGGIIGEIANKKSDISASVTVVYERTLVVQFSKLYFYDPLTFVVRKEAPPPEWMIIVRPFPLIMWLYLLLAIGVTGPTMWFLFNSSSETKKRMLKEKFRTMSTFYLQSVAGICNVSIRFSNRMNSVRLFVCFWWIFCLLITAIYRSSLIAFINIPSKTPKINTLLELTESNMNWCQLTFKDSFYELIRTSDNEVYKKIFKHTEMLTEEQCMRKVWSRTHAFLSYNSFLLYSVARDFTDHYGNTAIYMAKQEFFPGGYGCAFPKGSPYVKRFDRFYQQLIEGGLIDLWMKEILKESRKKESVTLAENLETASVNKDAGPEPFAWKHLKGAFIVFASLLLISLMCFGAEVLIFKQ